MRNNVVMMRANGRRRLRRLLQHLLWPRAVVRDYSGPSPRTAGPVGFDPAWGL